MNRLHFLLQQVLRCVIVATPDGDKSLDARLEAFRRREQELTAELEAAKKTVTELTASVDKSKTKTDQVAVAMKATDLQVRISCLRDCFKHLF